MLPHQTLDDRTVEGAATFVAHTLNCAENGHIPSDPVYAYGKAQTDLLSVSSYNKKLYEETFQRVKDEQAHSPRRKQDCQAMSAQLPSMIEGTRRRYNELKAARMEALVGMSQPYPSYQPSAYSYNVPQPSGEVKFGPPTSPNQHYLIQGNGRQSLCTVTPSGYVICH